MKSTSIASALPLLEPLHVDSSMVSILKQAHLSATSSGTIGYNNILIGKQQISLTISGEYATNFESKWNNTTVLFRPDGESLDMLRMLESMKQPGSNVPLKDFMVEGCLKLKLLYTEGAPQFTANFEFDTMEVAGLQGKVTIIPGFYTSATQYGLFFKTTHLTLDNDD